MSSDEVDEAKIRKQIEKRYKERDGVRIHAAAFIACNVLLWAIYFMIMPGDFPWPLIVTLGWGIGFAGHYLSYYYRYGEGAQKREDDIQREIDQYRERRQYEKPKREGGSHLELSEDGEIEEIHDDQPSSAQKRG